jgi:hypothetical protein
MKKLIRGYIHYWVIGTIATFAIAWLLWRNNKPIEAAAVVMLSPFPWPGPEV